MDLFYCVKSNDKQEKKYFHGLTILSISEVDDDPFARQASLLRVRTE